MKSIAFCVFLIIPLSLSSQKRGKLPNPPNGIYLYDNLFIDQTEVANIHWLEFLYFIKRDSSEEYYDKMLPNKMVEQSLVYLKEGDFVMHSFIVKDNERRMTEFLCCDYFKNHYFRNHPIIGVSKWQAEQFCKWRSTVVNDRWRKNRPKNHEAKKKKIGFKVVYRLPTKEEWEYSAQACVDKETFPFGISKLPKTTKWHETIRRNTLSKNSLNKQEKEALKKFLSLEESKFNLMYERPQFINYGAITIGPWHTRASPPNNFEIYSMLDNVSEFVQEDELVKGGSWIHNRDQVDICRDYSFKQKTAPWVGFRCVAEIIKIDE
ncbi:formylglycine-generating enzyme family protein [Reichenbachiella versicolor]|uniref:formylglycine-generating enzyme family protein n=1 Tax=Reichenbachiella versicolor TaxID=1821036 RepID=UPI000D6E179B|nr:SUMF1/EgtB/PvdO family nonheme iron enzyme [Reichenbachiella versicolor]